MAIRYAWQRLAYKDEAHVLLLRTPLSQRLTAYVPLSREARKRA